MEGGVGLRALNAARPALPAKAASGRLFSWSAGAPSYTFVHNAPVLPMPVRPSAANRLQITVTASPRLRRLLRRAGDGAAPVSVWVVVGDEAPVLAQQSGPRRPRRAAAVEAPADAAPTPVPEPVPADQGARFGWVAAAPAAGLPGDAGHAFGPLARRVIRHVRGYGDQAPINGVSPTLGLTVDEFLALRSALGASVLGPSTDAAEAPAPDARALKMLALLWDSRGEDSALTRAVAAAIACAAREDHHLWVDLGLPGRDQVNQLIKNHFPALYRRNASHVGWKKFLLLQIGEAAPTTRRGPVAPALQAS